MTEPEELIDKAARPQRDPAHPLPSRSFTEVADILENLSTLFGVARDRRHLSIRAAAEQLDVAPSTVARLESGAEPSLGFAVRVLEWLEEDCPTCGADAHGLADPEQGSEPHAAHDRFIPSVMSKLKGWQQELTTREQYVLDAAMEVHLALTKHQVDEMADFAGVQANARRESDRVRNLAARQAADLRDELATARQETEDVRESHALVVSDRDELSIKLEDVTIALQGDADFKPVLVNPAVDQIQALRTERDQLQARIDATLALLDAPGGVRYGHLHELRAALQGDQPAPVLPGDETPQPEEDQP